MSTITTVTGKRFDPLHPVPQDIDIMDICHALSLLCRANGHVKYFFSVAQHSVNCCMEAKRRGLPENVQLACLLHDAAEAYLADVTRPVKVALPEYCHWEETLLRAVWDKFLDGELTASETKSVFEIDDDMLSYEFLHLMPQPIDDRFRNILSEPEIACMPPQDAEKRMLELFWSLRHRRT